MAHTFRIVLTPSLGVLALALSLLRLRGLVGPLAGSLYHFRLCAWRRRRSGWWRFRGWWWFPGRRLPRRWFPRWWFPGWWFPGWRLSRRGIWSRSGSRPGRPLCALWLRLRLSLWLQQLLRRWLLSGSAAHMDALRLETSPNSSLRLIAQTGWRRSASGCHRLAAPIRRRRRMRDSGSVRRIWHSRFNPGG